MDFLRKYAVWIILVLSILLQVSLVPYMSVLWFKPDIPIIVLTFIAVRRGSLQGMFASFGTGVVVDSLHADFFGISSFCYLLATFVSGKLFYYNIPMPIRRWGLASGVSTLVYSVLYSFIYTLDNDHSFLQILIMHSGPMFLYTWAIALIWAISPLYEKRDMIRL